MRSFHLKISVIVFCFIVSCSKDELPVNIEDTIIPSITSNILELVNEHRETMGKQPLEINTLATDLANEHTLYMISEGAISHENFRYRASQLFIKENATNSAENVAKQYSSAENVMKAWLESEPHRKNIEGDFTHIGISAIKDDFENYYYTQLFFKKQR